MPDPTTALVSTLLAAADAAADDAWEAATVKAYAAGAATVTVRVRGTDVVVRRLKAYTPVVGEVAILGRVGSSLFAIGALA